MKFTQVIDNYLDKLSKEHETALSSGQFTAELSYRNSLHSFFEEFISIINTDIRMISEPKNQNKAGRPDWRFHDNKSMGVYGFIEAKGLSLDEEINPKKHEKQIKKYLALGHKVILTDGIEFLLFSPDTDEIEKCSLIKKPFSGFKDIEVAYDSESFFRMFFNEIGYRYVSEEQLIEEVARRTKELAGNIEEMIGYDPDWFDDEVEKRTIETLLLLKGILERQHDSNLDSDKLFADFIAQILTFGLLYAHRLVRDDEYEPYHIYEKLYTVWADIVEYSEYTEELYPFKALIRLLDNELNDSLSTLGLWYDDTRRLLSYIKLTKTQHEVPSYHVLYEKFLAIYDPQTRFELGSFYTPTTLASYSVKLVSELVSKYFPDSVQYDDSTKIIDPSCGTGAFLEELLKNYPEGKSPITIGFEIHPVPYALAHYRLAMFPKTQNLHIVLTNTLSDTLEDEIVNPTTNLLELEQNKAKTLSRPPLTIIIGNPPSSDSKSNFSTSGEIINALLNDFRPPEERRKARQNTQKQIKNEFVKFTRWACEKLLSSKLGVLCFILPLSFAENVSYKYARKWMLEHFDTMWILEFDDDLRSGIKSESIFDTQQGRMLLVGTMKEAVSECNLYHKSICELSKKDKIAFLSKEFSKNEIIKDYTKLELNRDTYAFVPKRHNTKAAVYTSFYDLCQSDDTINEQYIFARHCSGVKFAPTHLFVHADRSQLLKRTKDIANLSNKYDELKSKWYTGMSKPPQENKIDDKNIRKLLDEAVRKREVQPYAYRPFLTTSALLNDQLLWSLSKMGGGGTRYRPEVVAAFKDKKTFGICVTPAPKDVSVNLNRLASFGWHIPDNDLSSRGSSHIFCNYFPEYKKGKKKWNATPVSNVNPRLLNKLALKFELDEGTLINMILHYTYAIISSKYYLQEFESELFSVAGYWPKIPLIEDPETFISLANYGASLASVEKEDYIVKNGQYLTTFEELHKDDYQLKGMSYDSENKILILTSTDGNKMIEIEDIPEYLVTYEISGYSVVKEWLKMHSYSYLRKLFTKSHFVSFLNLLDKIQEQENIILDIDLLLQNKF
jgi:hypothetical protein